MARSSQSISSRSSVSAAPAIEKRLERLELLMESLASRGERAASEGIQTDSAMQPGYCSLPVLKERTFGEDVSNERAELIRAIDKKWVNGTTLHYYFFKDGPFAGHPSNVDLVREGFAVWDALGIGISFEEVGAIADAEIRIGFKRGDGAWSYVGRDVIDVPGQLERTMNFGWDLRQDPRGVDTPVHEIGHTLGFPHEHQNPFAGIVWDEEAVYRYFGGPPNNWSRDKTFHNVLRKLSSREVEGSNWDPDSIMHYAFPAGLIVKPSKYNSGLSPAPGLSADDKSQMKKFYPKSDANRMEGLEPFKSNVLELGPAEQKNFVLTPDATRQYQIKLFGEADALMVLFRVENGEMRYMAGSDDSGTSDNAQIAARLEAGSEYILRVRMFAPYGSSSAAVMYW